MIRLTLSNLANLLLDLNQSHKFEKTIDQSEIHDLSAFLIVTKGQGRTQKQAHLLVYKVMEVHDHNLTSSSMTPTSIGKNTQIL
jgi:hypothetical protein